MTTIDPRTTLANLLALSCGGSSPPGPCLLALCPPLPLVRRSYQVETLARSASRISGDSMVFVSLFPPASSSSVLPYAALPPSHRPSESKSTTPSLRWMVNHIPLVCVCLLFFFFCSLGSFPAFKRLFFSPRYVLSISTSFFSIQKKKEVKTLPI